MSIRILLTDDHEIVRQGLRSLIEKEPDIEVVGEAEDGRKVLGLVRQLLPDVVVMDISMPNLHSRRAFVADMLKAGASGYVLKECPVDELIEAIRAVAAGDKHLSPKVAGVVVSDYVKHLSGSTESPLETLTAREREVLQLVSEGKNTKQIALELHVSTKAIEANRRKIMEKLHAHSIAELVKIAILSGLTSLEV
ncbi:MAG: LuxR C-terminal-related transcriptional regulator [Planctomycetota bacterium]|jgi:DNA-binding NarL/FixJ family response regulator